MAGGVGAFFPGTGRTHICQIYLGERIAVPVFGFGIDAAGFHFSPFLELIMRRRGEILRKRTRLEREGEPA